MKTQDVDGRLSDYNQRLQAAEEMLPIIGRLWRDHGVPTYVYGNPLHLKGPIQILQAHRKARHLAREELSAVDTLKVVKVLSQMPLAPARIDVGKLLNRFQTQTDDLPSFLKSQLDGLAEASGPLRSEPQDVVLYGFGRIGRLLTRLLVERMGGGERFRLRAIVTRPGGADDIGKRVDLLRRDSVHGPFSGIITVDRDQRAMVINGNVVHLIYSHAPEETDYVSYGIKNALVIDNTGIWRDRDGLGRHLKADGVSQVVLTAPGKGDIPNVVYGINHELLHGDEDIISAASCTTNAIVPVLKAVNERFGIQGGHMQSVHAYTNDQNLIDNYHKKQRRGRSAALNMVLTETGAGTAVARVCPELAGLLTANAIRVPTPNVSMAIINLTLKCETSKAELNGYLRGLSLEGPLQYQIDYTTSPDIVSTDLVGNRHASIVDSHGTLVHPDGRQCTLYIWYDNEFGYACQVIRVIEEMAQVRPRFYPR